MGETLRELRFSSRTQQHQQRFPEVIRSFFFSRASLLVYRQAESCALPVSTFGTTHSLWIPDRVASGAPLGSSLVRFGSVSSKPESICDKAALARSVSSSACPLTFPSILFSGFLFSVCVKSGAFPHFSPQLGPGCWGALSGKKREFCRKLGRKLSLQLRLLTQSVKLPSTKKAWHKLQQRRMPEGLKYPKAISKRRPRGHPL